MQVRIQFKRSLFHISSCIYRILYRCKYSLVYEIIVRYTTLYFLPPSQNKKRPPHMRWAPLFVITKAQLGVQSGKCGFTTIRKFLNIKKPISIFRESTFIQDFIHDKKCEQIPHLLLKP